MKCPLPNHSLTPHKTIKNRQFKGALDGQKTGKLCCHIMTLANNHHSCLGAYQQNNMEDKHQNMLDQVDTFALTWMVDIP